MTSSAKVLGSSNGTCSMTNGGLSGCRLIDQILGAFDHRQGFESQKVEFDEPDFFDVSHRILGDDFVVGAFVERHVVGERSFRDHDTGGVSRGVAGQSFERTGRCAISSLTFVSVSTSSRSFGS